jgi:photosystem II stability/assembly factor-like uncharacterized protein
LQRSFDQGKTWQEVDVNANPAYAENATSVEASANTPHAKNHAKNKDARKALKREPGSPTFRAIAANGTDVWAGGSGGALYHSPDRGNYWIRVLPASSGAMLTGDIVSLDFADPQHGKVLTSTAETWTTNDEGQSWQKQ